MGERTDIEYEAGQDACPVCGGFHEGPEHVPMPSDRDRIAEALRERIAFQRIEGSTSAHARGYNAALRDLERWLPALSALDTPRQDEEGEGTNDELPYPDAVGLAMSELNARGLPRPEDFVPKSTVLPAPEGGTDDGAAPPPRGTARQSSDVDTLRVPGFDFDVPVVIDPEDEHRGIVRYEGHQNRPTIYLREWDDRVLLHETLHLLVASWRHGHQREPCLTPGTEVEEQFVRHLTHLYELGWRLEPKPAGTGGGAALNPKSDPPNVSEVG